MSIKLLLDRVATRIFDPFSARRSQGNVAEIGQDALTLSEMSPGNHTLSSHEITPTKGQLSKSLKSTVEKTFTAGSTDEGRVSPHDNKISLLKSAETEKISVSSSFGRLELYRPFYDEWCSERERVPYFSLKRPQDNAPVSFSFPCPLEANPLILACMEWAPQDVFSIFSLSRPQSILQILLVQYFQSPLEPDEEATEIKSCSFLLSSSENDTFPPKPFKVLNTLIALLSDYKIHVTWEVQIDESEKLTLFQEVEILPQKNDKLPCMIKMKRTAATPQEQI